MGQYYHSVNLDKKEHLSGNGGIKLMEHSWIENDFVKAVETLLTKYGPWYKNKIVWAGDYANGEINKEEEASNSNPNIYDLLDENEYRFIVPYEIDKVIAKAKIDISDYKYIINHTKKLYVDKTLLPEDDGWIVHPLPLLTAEGNGRGGGDYSESYPDIKLVGTWARDSISIEKEIPKDYKLLEVNFIEK